MLLGGLSKGVCALFAELALLAHRQGMLRDLTEATSRTYPGIAALVARMLPTYPRHASRRETEMSELEATARAAGMRPRVIEAVCRVHEEFARAWPPGASSAAGFEAADAAALIHELADRLKEAEVV